MSLFLAPYFGSVCSSNLNFQLDNLLRRAEDGKFKNQPLFTIGEVHIHLSIGMQKHYTTIHQLVLYLITTRIYLPNTVTPTTSKSVESPFHHFEIVTNTTKQVVLDVLVWLSNNIRKSRLNTYLGNNKSHYPQNPLLALHSRAKLAFHLHNRCH